MPLHEKPNFAINDATITQSGKLIRLFGKHEANAEGRELSSTILVEADKFEKMKKTSVEENGKTREKVEGLIGAVIKEPVVRFKNAAKEGEEPSWLTFLHGGTVVFKSGKEFGYKETPLPPKEEQQQSAAAPGM